MRTWSPFFGDDPLHERLLGLERVVEHDDVADLRVADAVRELVDDQAILILQRRRHAHAFDARDLEAERDDQRGVDGGGRERLQPRDELFAEAVQPERRAVEREARLDGGDRGDRRRRSAARPGQRLGGRGSSPARGHTAPRAAAPAAHRPRPAAAAAGRTPPPASRRSAAGRAPEPAARRRRGKRIVVVTVAHNFRYSRSRRVCERLTGISVPLPSFIFRM